MAGQHGIKEDINKSSYSGMCRFITVRKIFHNNTIATPFQNNPSQIRSNEVKPGQTHTPANSLGSKLKRLLRVFLNCASLHPSAPLSFALCSASGVYPSKFSVLHPVLGPCGDIKNTKQLSIVPKTSLASVSIISDASQHVPTSLAVEPKTINNLSHQTLSKSHSTLDNTTLPTNPFEQKPTDTLPPINSNPPSTSITLPNTSPPDQPSPTDSLNGGSTSFNPTPTSVSFTTLNSQQPSSSIYSGNPTPTTDQEATSGFSNPLPTSSPSSSSLLPTDDQSTFTPNPPSSTSPFSPSATTEPPAQPTSTSTIPDIIIPSTSVRSETQSSSSSVLTASPPAASSQYPQTFRTTSNVVGTTTGLDGTIHTFTAFVDAVPYTIQTTIFGTASNRANASSGLLNSDPTQSDGFFDHKGAVVGTFLTLGLLVIAGLAAILWRFARLRKAHLRGEGADPDMKFDQLGAKELEEDGRNAMLPSQIDDEELHAVHTDPDNHHHIDHSLAFALMDPDFTRGPSKYRSSSGPLGMPLANPARFSGWSQAKGRASDLDTLNTEEWSQYVNTYFTPGRGSILADGSKIDLLRVEEEVIPPEVPASSSHPSNISPAMSEPDVQTVEQENFSMVNSPNFAWNDRFDQGDERLELLALPAHRNQSYHSDGRGEVSNSRDEEEYRASSRRILQVSNPDVQ